MQKQHSPRMMDLCIFSKKCEFQKEHIIGKYYGKNPLPVFVCTFDSTCNQKRQLDITDGRKLWDSLNLTVKRD